MLAAPQYFVQIITAKERRALLPMLVARRCPVLSITQGWNSSEPHAANPRLSPWDSISHRPGKIGKFLSKMYAKETRWSVQAVSGCTEGLVTQGEEGRPSDG